MGNKTIFGAFFGSPGRPSSRFTVLLVNARQNFQRRLDKANIFIDKPSLESDTGEALASLRSRRDNLTCPEVTLREPPPRQELMWLGAGRVPNDAAGSDFG